jgi:hypothetical protein
LFFSKGLFYNFGRSNFPKIMRLFKVLLLVCSVNLVSNAAMPSVEVDSLTAMERQMVKFLSDSKVSAQLFLGYRYHSAVGESHNEFAIKRGYITFSKNITPYLSGRITPDITVDQEGDGEGDVEMRLKYCFAEFKDPTRQGFFTEPSILIGQVYTPFIEYEEKINRYRVEGAHYLDRIDQVSSADFGITLTSLIGGKMDEDFQKRVNSNHAGKYGSFALGVYNGGGYNALEKNDNKTFQWRLTLRPLPNHIPGLQTSFTGALGKGNTPAAPDWNLYAGFLSFEQEYFVITGQVYQALGDHTGRLVDPMGNPFKNWGQSLFGEVKLFSKKASIFARYDNNETYDTAIPTYSTRYIFGVAYHIQGKTKVVVDYNYLDNNQGNPVPDTGIFEVMLELAF